MTELVKSGSKKVMRVCVNPKYSVVGPSSLTAVDKQAYIKWREAVAVGRRDATIQKWKRPASKYCVVLTDGNGYVSETLPFEEAMHLAYVLYVRKGLYRR